MSRGKPNPKELPNGEFQGRITWSDPVTGKRREFTKTFVVREDCVEWLDLVYLRRERGTLHDYFLEQHKKVYTVVDLMEDYYESRAYKSLDRVTRKNYESYVRRIVLPKFGKRAADSVHIGDIKNFVSDLIDEGRSPTAIRQCTSPLSMAYEEAIEDKRLDHNPVRPVKIEPRKHKRKKGNKSAKAGTTTDTAPEAGSANGAEKGVADDEPLEEIIRPFKEHELGLLYKAFSKSRARDVLHLILAMGLRPSEAVALMWGDVNLMRRKLTINRASEEDGTLGPCKSSSAYRTLTIPTYLAIILAERKPEGAKDRDLVFPSRTGRVMLVSSVRKAFKRVLTKVEGLDPAHRLYDLRHTHASFLWHATRDIKAICKRLGHSSEAFTLRQYVWMREADDEALADVMDELHASAVMP